MMLDPVAFIKAQTGVTAPSILPEIVLHLANEITPLWQQTEETMKETNMPPPFWAFAWPGGQGMARHILDNPQIVRGKKIVDFAAGSGLVAIAAMKAGAKSALAVDICPFACHAIALNAQLNDVGVSVCGGLDLTRAYAKADIIFAGDICYQQAMSATLTRWLRLCIDKGVAVFLSDPGRAYVPTEGLVEIGRYNVPTSRDLEDSDNRSVTVWRMNNL